MQNQDCNFTPLKNKLKEQLSDITRQLQHIIVNLDQDSSCLLGELDLVRTKFLEAESISSTYYLNCFLFPFHKQIPRNREIHISSQSKKTGCTHCDSTGRWSGFVNDARDSLVCRNHKSLA